jgi:hypothetical protein
LGNAPGEPLSLDRPCVFIADLDLLRDHETVAITEDCEHPKAFRKLERAFVVDDDDYFPRDHEDPSLEPYDFVKRLFLFKDITFLRDWLLLGLHFLGDPNLDIQDALSGWTTSPAGSDKLASEKFSLLDLKTRTRHPTKGLKFMSREDLLKFFHGNKKRMRFVLSVPMPYISTRYDDIGIDRGWKCFYLHKEEDILYALTVDLAGIDVSAPTQTRRYRAIHDWQGLHAFVQDPKAAFDSRWPVLPDITLDNQMLLDDDEE